MEATKAFMNYFAGNQIFVAMPDNSKTPPKHIPESIDECYQELYSHNQSGLSIFFTVNDLDQNLDPDKHRTKKMVTNCRAIFMDADDPQSAPLDSFSLEPSIIVETSKGKYHYYWLTSTNDFEEWDAIQRQLIADYNGDKQAKDLARYLRLPGFYHLKDKKNPYLVRVIGGNFEYYSWTEITDNFPKAEVSGSDANPSSRIDTDAQSTDELYDIIEGGLDGLHGAINKVLWGFKKDNVAKHAAFATVIRIAKPAMKFLAEQGRGRENYLSESELERSWNGAEDSTHEVKQPIEFNEKHIFKSDPIPDEILPASLLQAAEEIGDWTSSGKEPAVLSGIGAISALLNKNVKIHVVDDDLVVYSTIAQLIGSMSGARKTTIYEKMNAPFFTYSARLEKEWEAGAAERKVMHKALSDSLKKANRNLVGKPDEEPKTSKEIEKEALGSITLQRELDKIDMVKPTLFVGDITESKLIRKIYENNNILAVFSDDARNFIKNLLGRNRNDGDTDEGIYIAGITNGDYPFNRVGQGGDTIDIMLYKISLNILTFVQIDKTVDLLKSEMYSGSGLAARLPLYVHPIDGVKMLRNTSRRSINKEKMKPYYDALNSLCVKLDEPIDIRMSEEAGEEWIKFSHEMADMVDEGGEWEGEYEVMNKITTTACIYATIFMAIENSHFLTLGDREISKEYFIKGAKYAKFITDQSIKAQKYLERVFSLRGVPVVLGAIRRDYKSAQPKWRDGFKNNSAFKNCQSITHRKNMDTILEYLVETNWLLKDKEGVFRLNVEGIEMGIVKYDR